MRHHTTKTAPAAQERRQKRPCDHLPLTREIEGAALHLAGLINAGSPLNDDLRALKRVLLGAADMARALESRALASNPSPQAEGKRRELIYLACPYSDPSPNVMVCRTALATAVAAVFMAHGKAVFSPLTHGHTIWEMAMAQGVDVGQDAAAWAPVNDAMLTLADEVMVVSLEGCFDSVGVRREVALAARMGKPVSLVHPGDTPGALSIEPVDPMLWSDAEGRL